MTPGTKPRHSVTLNRIADAAGVSRATVDRVLNERPGVQSHTRKHVLGIANTLRGGQPVDEPRAASPSARTKRFGFIVPDGNNAFVNELVDGLRHWASRRDDVNADVVRARALSADAVAEAISKLAERCDGLGIIGPDAPPVREAMRRAMDTGMPVVTMVTDIAHVGRASYIGIDNRAAGRLAGYLIGRFAAGASCTVAMVPGSLAYRGHEEREAGFRRVLRERFRTLRIVADSEVDEDDDRAYEAMTAVLQDHPDLGAVYCIGAGEAGIVRALTEASREHKTILVGHELTNQTRSWLLSGVMDAAIDQNPRAEAREAIERLTQALAGDIPLASGTVRIQPVFGENLPHDS